MISCKTMTDGGLILVPEITRQINDKEEIKCTEV